MIKEAGLILGLVIIGSAANATGVGDGGGGDTVEVRFTKAKDNAIRDLQTVAPSNIGSLNISQEFKDWLSYSHTAGVVRLSLLQYYSRHLQLNFQDEPCFEAGKPRATSFDISNPDVQNVCVSRSMNNAQHTTENEAEALLIHEAGHFTGEMNHGFLSDMGQQLVTAVQHIEIPCSAIPEMRKQHKPVTHCTTSVGVEFTYVRDPVSGAWGWKDSAENGRIWFTAVSGNSEQWEASGFCASKTGQELPSREAFQIAQSHGFTEVMYNLRSSWFWTSYVGRNPGHTSCGVGDGVGMVHYFFSWPDANLNLTCGGVSAKGMCVSTH